MKLRDYHRPIPNVIAPILMALCSIITCFVMNVGEMKQLAVYMANYLLIIFGRHRP